MTDPTDTLRPEVRRALLRADRWKRGDCSWPIIRAELLRLAAVEAEHERWRKYHRWNIEHTSNGLVVCRGLHDKDEKCEQELFVPIERAERAEAELAALRARIAEAPFVSVRVDDDKHVSLGARSHPKDFAHLHGKRVRLVREDGDA